MERAGRHSILVIMAKTSVIKTGFQCNNNCIFCIQDNSRYTKKTQSTEEVKKILKENVKTSKEIVLTGGEVTIRGDIFELVKFAKECGYESIQVQSNGRMFSYMDFCEKLINVGANEFGISIHGSTSEIHDKLIRVEGGFKQVYKGLNNLKELKQKICTNTVVTKINYKDLPNITKILIDFNVFEHNFTFLYLNFNIMKDKKLIEEIAPKYVDVRKYIEKCLRMGIEAKIKIRTEAFPFCVLGKKYHHFIKALCVPDNIVYENDIIFDFKGKNIKSDIGKKKFEICKQCKFYDVCEGPWISYGKIFGEEEFKPIN